MMRHTARGMLVSAILLLSACAGPNYHPTTQVTSPQAPPAPPPAPMETKTPQPSASYVWVPGAYVWQAPTRTYLWVPGHWAVPPAGQVWVPGHWESTPTGYTWVDGRWRQG
jgi:hypothetical protein